jgi:hypothetical protein
VVQSIGLVFSVREPKSLLTFCESSDCHSVSLQYHDGGRPVLLTAQEGQLLVELVLATVEPGIVMDPSEAYQGTLARQRTQERLRGDAGAARSSLATSEEREPSQNGARGPEDDSEERLSPNHDHDDNGNGNDEDFAPPPNDEQEHEAGMEDARPPSAGSTARDRHGQGSQPAPSQQSITSADGASRLMALRNPAGDATGRQAPPASQGSMISITSSRGAEKLMMLKGVNARATAEAEDDDASDNGGHTHKRSRGIPSSSSDYGDK